MKLAITVLLVLVLVVGAVLLGGFIWMICLGALGHIFDVKNLEISYWKSVLVSLIAGLLIGGVRAGNKN